MGLALSSEAAAPSDSAYDHPAPPTADHRTTGRHGTPVTEMSPHRQRTTSHGWDGTTTSRHRSQRTGRGRRLRSSPGTIPLLGELPTAGERRAGTDRARDGAPAWRRTGAPGRQDDVVDDAVGLRLLGRHEEVPIDVPFDLLERLSAVKGDDLRHPPGGGHHLAQMDL